MEKIVATFFAAIAFFVGLAFLLAKPFTIFRGALGLLLMAVSLFILYMAFRRKEAVIVSQTIDATGPINAHILKCRNCGAELDKNSLSTRLGAIFITCPYCHSEYQIEEEPKW